MAAEIRKRLRWVELFLRIENYTMVCLKCGISLTCSPKWVRRYPELGIEGLSSVNRRPKSLSAVKIPHSDTFHDGGEASYDASAERIHRIIEWICSLPGQSNQRADWFGGSASQTTEIYRISGQNG